MHDVSFTAANDVGAVRLPFSAAVRVGNLLFISGQASTAADGSVIYGDFEQEMRRALDNLAFVLRRCGASFADVIQTRNYIKNGSDLPRFNELYREYFSPPYPARTSLTGCLDKLKYEIDAIAVVRVTAPSGGEPHASA